MFDEINDKDAVIAELVRQVEMLTQEVVELRRQIAEKDKIIVAQAIRIKELEEQVKKNSQNSSKPPASDGYKKVKPVSNREKTGRKAGAQTGHKGKGFRIPKADIIEEVAHIPEKCKGCVHFGTCQKNGESPVRNEIDVEIKVVLRKHYTVSYDCPLERTVLTGEFPEGIHSSMQYGPGVQSMAATLNTEGMMSVQRTHDYLSAVLGLSISTGTIAAMVRELARQVRGTVESVFQALMYYPVNNCDETGVRVEGKVYWLHSVCNALFTYLSVQEKRGEAGMRAIGFLSKYTGTIVSDCWGAYWKFPQLSHALCNAHIMRELKGVSENHPGQTWAGELRALLQKMAHCRNETMRAERSSLTPETVLAFQRQYDALLDEAASLNPVPARKPGQRGKTPKGKVRALIDRLREHRDEALLFLTDIQVPFSNNLAEQSIRMAKVKGKVSGCLRTVSGAKDFATIMSYIGSVKKHGINVFTAVKEAFLGNSYGVLFPV